MGKALTEKQSAFLQHLFGEAAGNYREAARLAGYSDQTSMGEIIAGVKEHIIEHSVNYLSANAAKAVIRMVGELDAAAPNANRLKAADMVLNRIGVLEKKNDPEAVKVDIPKGGIFILPAKEVQTFEKVLPDEAEQEVEDTGTEEGN